MLQCKSSFTELSILDHLGSDDSPGPTISLKNVFNCHVRDFVFVGRFYFCLDGDLAVEEFVVFYRSKGQWIGMKKKKENPKRMHQMSQFTVYQVIFRYLQISVRVAPALRYNVKTWCWKEVQKSSAEKNLARLDLKRSNSRKECKKIEYDKTWKVVLLNSMGKNTKRPET